MRYFPQERQGPGAARNNGTKHATGEWLIFLDADDYFIDNVLPVFKQGIEDNRNASMIIASAYGKSADGKIKKRDNGLFSLSKQNNFLNLIKRKLKLYPGCSTMQRNIFNRLGGYAEKIFHSEDDVLWGKSIANYEVAVIDLPVVYVCAHPGRLRDNFDSYKKQGLQSIELLFDARYIPSDLMKYKPIALAEECQSLAHRYYQHKDYKEALNWYHQAWKYSCFSCCNVQTLKRYSLSWVKS